MKPLHSDTEWGAVATALKDAKGILLVTHKSPDSDGIGSQLALYCALKAMGKKAWVHNLDPLPRICRYLEGSSEVTSGPEFAYLNEVDTIVSVDCGAISRLGMNETLFGGRCLINIDHHASNTGFGDINIVDAGYCATGAMIFDLLLYLEAAITPPIASAIYVALLTDTASFRLSTVTADVFRLAADLVEAGADPNAAAKAVYGSNSHERMALLKLSLDTLEMHDDGRSAWLHVDHEMYRATAAGSEDTEGFIDYGRSIDGVMITVFIRPEDGEAKEESAWKVSFRGAKGIDVGSLADELGGGGHRYAAGCTLNGTLEEVQEKVRSLVKQFISH